MVIFLVEYPVQYLFGTAFLNLKKNSWSSCSVLCYYNPVSFFAALTKPTNNGPGLSGLDLNSG